MTGIIFEMGATKERRITCTTTESQTRLQRSFKR